MQKIAGDKEKQGDEHGAAITYHNLGFLALGQGEHETAGRWLIRAARGFWATRDQYAFAKTAHVYRDLLRQAPDGLRAELIALWDQNKLPEMPSREKFEEMIMASDFAIDELDGSGAVRILERLATAELDYSEAASEAASILLPPLSPSQQAELAKHTLLVLSEDPKAGYSNRRAGTGRGRAALRYGHRRRRISGWCRSFLSAHAFRVSTKSGWYNEAQNNSQTYRQ